MGSDITVLPYGSNRRQNYSWMEAWDLWLYVSMAWIKNTRTVYLMCK